ncbi:hypothetical protein [Rickettsia endosymbiont of Polydrusus tereticollis]
MLVLCHSREGGNPGNNSHPEFISVSNCKEMLNQVQHDKSKVWIPAFS